MPLKATSSELNHVSKQDIINRRGLEGRVGGRDEVTVEKNEREVDEGYREITRGWGGGKRDERRGRELQRGE